MGSPLKCGVWAVSRWQSCWQSREGPGGEVLSSMNPGRVRGPWTSRGEDLSHVGAQTGQRPGLLSCLQQNTGQPWCASGLDHWALLLSILQSQFTDWGGQPIRRPYTLPSTVHLRLAVVLKKHHPFLVLILPIFGFFFFPQSLHTLHPSKNSLS